MTENRNISFAMQFSDLCTLLKEANSFVCQSKQNPSKKKERIVVETDARKKWRKNNLASAAENATPKGEEGKW